MRAITSITWLSCIIVIFTAGTLMAANPAPRKPGPSDKCPVCGMFVAKYPDFTTQMLFKDGTTLFFDGSKDMFKHYFKLNSPSNRKTADIAAMYVTDYYSLELFNGFNAFFVTGSDMYGPMGREFIPFAKESDAKEFLRDHKGKSILRFQKITPAMTLD